MCVGRLHEILSRGCRMMLMMLPLRRLGMVFASPSIRETRLELEKGVCFALRVVVVVAVSRLMLYGT